MGTILIVKLISFWFIVYFVSFVWCKIAFRYEDFYNYKYFKRERGPGIFFSIMNTLTICIIIISIVLGFSYWFFKVL